MLEVVRLVAGEYDANEVGCNNGVLKPMTVITRDSATGTIGEFQILTCACHRGCGGADRCPELGMRFKNTGSLIDWMSE